MYKGKKQVQVNKLKDKMVLSETIYDEEGKILYSKGLKLNETRIQRIQDLNLAAIFIESDEVQGPVKKEGAGKPQQINEEANPSERELKKEELIQETKAEATSIVQEAFSKVLSDGSVKSEKIKLIVEKIIDMILSDQNLVLNLSSLNAMDDYLLSHSVNVCVLSLMTGVVLGFNQVKLMKLGSGALIHDIGKILVPQDILKLPRKLTQEEFDEVKQHTVYGHKILRDSFKYDEETATIALSHHERVDGSGYPHGLNQHQIPIFAKIVAITDVFDAITSKRVYCDEISFTEAISYLIREGRGVFDEEVLKKFITIIGHYPMGMQVILSTGETAIVTRPKPSVPVVKVIRDKNHHPLNNYYEIDLQKNPTVTILDVIFKAL